MLLFGVRNTSNADDVHPFIGTIAPQHFEAISRCSIPEPDSGIKAAAGQDATIRVPGNIPNATLVASEGVEALAGLQVPEFNGTVITGAS